MLYVEHRLHVYSLLIVLMVISQEGSSNPFRTYLSRQFNPGSNALSCRTLTRNRGVVSSDTETNDHYDNGRNWCVVIETEMSVNLEFDGEFDVEPEYDNDRCLYDYIEIRQRYSTAAEEVVGRFCGLEPPVLPPLAGPVYIEFFTDHMITGYGWILEWETHGVPSNQESCSIYRDDSGSIESANYPDYYPNNIDECYVIMSDQRIQLVWDEPFRVHSRFDEGDCQHDYVEVFEQSTRADDNRLVGRYCGTSIPRDAILDGPIYIRFYTDWTMKERGWRVSWDIDGGRGGGYDCEYQSGLSGLLTSENYPDKYPTDSDYCVVIDANELVTLRWHDEFDVESKYADRACNYDFVEVRQRYSQSNPDDIVDTLCGRTSPGIQTIQGPVMIRHYSDGFVEGYGWSFQWITESYDPPPQEISCDRTENPTGRLTSDNYPRDYGPNSDWCVLIDIDEMITLDWDPNFHVEGQYFHGFCRYDYVDVQSQYLPDNPDGSSRTYCGNISPGKSEVLGPVMIRHVSDWIISGDGWSLQWTAESHLPLASHGCTVTRVRSGTISSDNYPNPYEHDQDYCTLIDADEMMTLQWNRNFNVEGDNFHGVCRDDYVEVRQRYSSSNPNDIVGTYCGSTAPRVQDIRGPVMITHHSDERLSGIGWSVNFITESYDGGQAPDIPEDCGDIDSVTGTLHSNYYPHFYLDDTDWCRYLTGEHIHIQFNAFFSIQYDSDCSKDYIEIQSAVDGIDRFCGSYAPEPKVYHGPVIIRFHSDERKAKRGFSLDFTISNS